MAVNMNALLFISDCIIPFTFVAILGYAWCKGAPLYDNFIEGAKEGIGVVIQILPTLIGLMVAVGILRASGAFEIMVSLISPLTDLLGFPKEAVPLTLMRLVSSSAATGLQLDIYKNYGADSFIGRFVGVMMSCTETVFYTMSVYFMSVKITKTRHTLPGALFANLAGIAASLFITRWVFGG